MDKKIRNDVIAWDVVNWSRAIEFWEKEKVNVEGKKVLDIGGRDGGLSLYWALQGANVVCTDIKPDGFDNAKKLHAKYQVDKKVTYKVLDATRMNYENEFDVISFKSVLGGVGYDNDLESQRIMMANIYTALKKGGYCFFAENLAATFLHGFAREKLRKRGTSWRYIKLSEMEELIQKFEVVDKKTLGFFGAFGRWGKWSLSWFTNFLGHIDALMDRFIKEKRRYIFSCVLKK